MPITTDLTSALQQYQHEVINELHNILHYWLQHAPDDENGGYYGRIDHDNSVHATAPKGAVLHARVLWAFSAACNYEYNEIYLNEARRAYAYLTQHFFDPEYGGFYWTVNYLGQPLDTKKQVYANAFVIYALTEYYRCSGEAAAKEQAIALYKLLVEKSYDTQLTGYLEAFTREWDDIADLRLSAKDANEKKTMNTHLHVLEAYTNLYRIWPDAELKQQIVNLLHNFLEQIYDEASGHLMLFFDERWNRRSKTVSYGHDIEAAWLLLEAAEVVADNDLIERLKPLAVQLADATAEGIDTDGGLWYEYEPDADLLIKQKHWWVQAEAMVGFLNAWQITNETHYAELSLRNWAFVKKHILDVQGGEWVWGIEADGSPMPGEDKAGLWKCPYHNSRACIEVARRLRQAAY